MIPGLHYEQGYLLLYDHIPGMSCVQVSEMIREGGMHVVKVSVVESTHSS